MTSSPSDQVIQASFSDFRLVKGRKVGQLVFEVPIEAVDNALAILGGVPRPDMEAWCAIARIDRKALVRPDHKKAIRAALLCEEPAFRRFLFELGCRADDADEAAQSVRDYCGVESRGSIDSDPKAAARWQKLVNDYNAWSLT